MKEITVAFVYIYWIIYTRNAKEVELIPLKFRRKRNPQCSWATLSKTLYIKEIVKIQHPVEKREIKQLLRGKKNHTVTLRMFRNSDSDFKVHGRDKVTFTCGREHSSREELEIIFPCLICDHKRWVLRSEGKQSFVNLMRQAKREFLQSQKTPKHSDNGILSP